MNYGLQLDEIKPEDFVLGAANELSGEILQPNANWFDFLPTAEYQSKLNLESYACVSFATLNCVEILERFEYGATTNYSDRFLAVATGTQENKGNSPQKVAEFLRKKGCVLEYELPFDETITTFEQFYAPLKQVLYTLALQFTSEFSFGHEYVPSNAKSLMEALKYSPLVFSTYAWVQDDDGLYYRPQGMTDNHATVCYGYEEGKYWLIYDTYISDGKPLKKIRWDSLPMQAKRFTLHRQVFSESAWTKFLVFLRRLAFGV